MQRLGRYRLAEMLGQGGMGAVFRARCLELERDVAIKVLAPHHRPDTLAREARMLARVSHPGVVRVLDVDHENGTAYYVMELVDAPTLEEIGPLGLERAIPVIGSLLAAVQAMHEAGVIHRDLKPANVFVEAGGQARVCDFGLACEPGAPVEGKHSGTLAYMAPEQMLGDDVSVRTDVYALGLLMHRVLAGALPFGGTTREIARAKLGGHELADVRELAPAVPAAVAEVLARACRQRECDRFASVADMRRAWKQALRIERPESGVRSPAQNIRLRRVRGTLGALVGMVAVSLRGALSCLPGPRSRWLRPAA